MKENKYVAFSTPFGLAQLWVSGCGEAARNACFVAFCVAAPCSRPQSFLFSFELNSFESPAPAEFSSRGMIALATGEGRRLSGAQLRRLGVSELKA